ncbi:MAG: recombinase RecA [Planctomycetota bacterium]|nr:recombinase RecA [Planctomycetota bacterium]
MTAEKNSKGKAKDLKRQALDYAIAQIQKRHGKGAIMQLGKDVPADIPVISTGSLSLDLALGVGGIPRGRVSEVFGPESSGKTTLALHIIANAQRNRGVAAFIDAEHALDPAYAKKLGVNLEDLLVSQPDTGEQALEITDMLVSSAAVDIVVIDSVAALVPRAELEGEMGDHHVGAQARLMSQALRKLTGSMHRSNTAVLFINQIREKIGVMFGSPETTPGGRALKFYSSIRIDIRRIGAIRDGENVIGNRTRAKVVKNKVASPFKKAEFDIIYNHGISWVGDVMDIATDAGIIQRNGSWFSYGEQRVGQGRERTIAFLTENPGVLLEIENDVLAKVWPEKNGRESAVPEPESAGKKNGRKK